MTDLANDLVELAHTEMMQRVLVPVVDDIPDPGANFDAFVSALMDRVERTVYALPRAERHAYFLEKARDALHWCKANRAPDVLTERVSLWLARLSAPDGNRRSSIRR